MSCLFCQIVSSKVKANVVFENSELLAFEDIKPQAPTHLLIIPKQHIATINDIDSKDEQLLGRMLLSAKQMAKVHGIDKKGYRLIFNVNPEGGQEIYHIHLHLLGGRQMNWPPG